MRTWWLITYLGSPCCLPTLLRSITWSLSNVHPQTGASSRGLQLFCPLPYEHDNNNTVMAVSNFITSIVMAIPRDRSWNDSLWLQVSVISVAMIDYVPSVTANITNQVPHHDLYCRRMTPTHRGLWLAPELAGKPSNISSLEHPDQ